MRRQYKHIEYCISFIRTLLIKLPLLALRENNIVKEKYGNDAVGDLPKTWRYYLNISGEKHFSNDLVLITLKETNQEVELTKDLLLKYKDTRNELWKQDEFYKSIISKYPNEILYIHGCMFPSNLDDVIDAPPGKILGYNPTLIEYNETEIIYELEQYIENVLSRYNINEYGIIDKHYPTVFASNLYASLVNVLLVARLRKINTHAVHPFYIEERLRSYMNIWDDASVLTPSSRYWLYNNIPTLSHHTGKQVTLDRIIKNIFTSNHIGVGEYTLDLNDPDRIPNPAPWEPSGSKNVSFTTKALNSIYSNEGRYPIDVIVSRELRSTYKDYDEQTSDEVNALVEIISKRLAESTITDQKTKLLDIPMPDIRLLHGIDPVLFILNKWIYYAASEKYTSLVSYIDPNTKKYYNITPRQGLLLLLKNLLYLNKRSSIKLTAIPWEHIINNGDFIPEVLVKGLFGKYQIIDMVKLIVKNAPLESNFTNSADFKNYLSNCFKWVTYIWMIDTNAENAIVSAGIKNVIARMLSFGVHTLTENTNGLTIDELLSIEEIEYPIETGFDIYGAISALFKTFTGVEIDYYTEAKNRYSKFKNILDKLTSYTVHVIPAVDQSKELYIPYNMPAALYVSMTKDDSGGNEDDDGGDGTTPPYNCGNRRGLAIIEEARIIDPLAPVGRFYINALGNDWRESKRCTVVDLNHPYILGESDDHFLGGRINYDHHKLNMVRAIVKRYSYLAPMILKAKGDDLDMHSLRVLMSDLPVINKDINPIYGQQTTFHTTARVKSGYTTAMDVGNLVATAYNDDADIAHSINLLTGNIITSIPVAYGTLQTQVDRATIVDEAPVGSIRIK